jgi:hypothetical protein
MKRTAIFFLIISLFTAEIADAQQGTRRRTRTRTRRGHTTHMATDSTYTFGSRRGGYSSGKSIDAGTTGVMGKDTIRVNERGRTRNLNYNTGTPLPPNSGDLK